MPSFLDLTPVGAVLDIGGKLIDKFWPDPATRDAAKLELFKAQQNGELAILAAETDLAKAQIDVNKEDAKSGNFWQSGWRPFIGWICGCGLGYQFLVYPILVAFVPKIVQLDMGTLLTLLAGLLGLGAMRSNEKIKGVA
jgi:hypothetical protein